MLEKIQYYILYWDYTAWHYLNNVWHTPLLDVIAPFLRNQWTWAPLYLFLAIFMPYNYGKRGIMWCVFFILTFAFCDYVSASILKPHFHRVRPCNNEYLQGMVRLLVPCGGGASFPSSHAANHFGLGIFAAITLHKRIKGIWAIALLWAIAVAWSQVYVGVHYPLDVTMGGLLGLFFAIITGITFKRFFNLPVLVPATKKPPREEVADI